MSYLTSILYVTVVDGVDGRRVVGGLGGVGVVGLDGGLGAFVGRFDGRWDGASVTQSAAGAEADN